RRRKDRALRRAGNPERVRGGAAEEHRAGGEREQSLHAPIVPESPGARIPLRSGRKCDDDLRALALSTFERDRAAVLLDERTRDCEPEAGTRNREPRRCRGAEE